MKVYIIFILFLLSENAFVFAKTFDLKGIILTENNHPIRDVVIGKNWNRKGVISQENGTFTITVNNTDTLVFNHLSYEPKAIAVCNISLVDTLKVILIPRTVELEEVQITNWGTWDDFKHKILSKNTDSIRNTPTYRLETMFPKIKLKIKNPYFKVINQTEVDFLFSLPKMIFTGENKKLKRLQEIEQEILKEYEITQNEYRYSSRILSKLFNLKGKELQYFKIFCDKKVTLSLNDYQLLEQLNRLYQEWRYKSQDDKKPL